MPPKTKKTASKKDATLAAAATNQDDVAMTDAVASAPAQEAGEEVPEDGPLAGVSQQRIRTVRFMDRTHIVVDVNALTRPS